MEYNLYRVFSIKYGPFSALLGPQEHILTVRVALCNTWKLRIHKDNIQNYLCLVLSVVVVVVV